MRVTRLSTLAALALTTFVVAACGDDPVEPEPELLDAEDVTYAPELGVDLSQMTRLASGVYTQDIVEGPADTVGAVGFNTLTTRYDAWLSDGTIIADGVALTFTFGTGEVISGWDLGLLGMRVGGIRRLVVPPAAGFGAFDQGPGCPSNPGPTCVPGNSVLVYDIELTDAVPPPS
jgi:peptidylprolyl isomerase